MTENAYLFNCFDLHTGQQDCCFYGKGCTEEEARSSAKIPVRYEVNEVFVLCAVDEIPEEARSELFN